MSGSVTFRERHRVPLWALGVGWAWCTFLAWAVGAGGTPLTWLAYGALPVVLLWGYASLLVVEVREGDVVVGRRAGGRRVPAEHIVAHRVLEGPALREVRNRLTPSFRLHCPIYERTGIQLVTEDETGHRVEHLYAVRDHTAFLRATGAVEHRVEPHRERGVPI